MDSIFKLEHDIASFIGTDNGCTVHFNYNAEYIHGSRELPGWKVDAYTVNPKSEETFLLKSESEKTKEKALKKILEYLKKQKGESPFSVMWVKKGDSKDENLTKHINVSHFYCHDILGVVERFFNGKNPEDYVIYEIKLNPIA